MYKFFTLILLASTLTFSQDSLVFVIRVDDIQSRNTSYLPAGITPFQTAVEQRGGKVTWAVIPHRLIEGMNTNGSVTKELKISALRGHEISQHGYNHICPKCNSTGHEFYCVNQLFHHSYTVQEQMLLQGKTLLLDSLGIVPKSFVPPGHYTDTTTFDVLVDNNFEFLSSSGVTKNYIFPGLYNLRQHQEYTWQLTDANFRSQMTKALFDIRTNGMSDKYFVILHHDPFIRQGYLNGIVVNWMGELMDSLNREFSGKIKYRTLTEAASSFRDIGTSVAENNLENPDNFKLLQNYPNPFNPSTKISYSIPENGFVTLRIFDLLGREITTLVASHQESGQHSVTFDASGLSSGIFVYRLDYNGKSLSGKMTILK